MRHHPFAASCSMLQHRVTGDPPQCTSYFIFAPGYQEFTPEGEVNANPRLLYRYLIFLLLTVWESCIDIWGVDGGRLLGQTVGHGISLWSVIYVYICTVRSPPKTDDGYLPLSSLWIRMTVTSSSSVYEFTPGREGNYNLRLFQVSVKFFDSSVWLQLSGVLCVPGFESQVWNCTWW